VLGRAASAPDRHADQHRRCGKRGVVAEWSKVGNAVARAAGDPTDRARDDEGGQELIASTVLQIARDDQLTGFFPGGSRLRHTAGNPPGPGAGVPSWSHAVAAASSSGAIQWPIS